MAAEWLGMAFVGAALACGAAMYGFVLGLAGLLWTHLRLRDEGMAREARLLAHPLPSDRDLPHVVVQLPVFNEGAIVERAIACAARLDWPRDKLHIQVCDDSTDATTGHARAAAERIRAGGVDVVVLHRDDRREFKAGALNAAREKTGHDYFAILDVDYVPPVDFLRRCMAVLLAEPRLAFAQARPDFLNTGENALTRAQAILMDFHYGFEQATRSWSGQALPFNGTCGVWRRAGIEAGGGWNGEMMTEDWDLSYRALMAGWRGMFLTTVTVPGELPTGLAAWISQQKRWSSGIGEVAWKMAPRLLMAGKFSPAERLRALLPLLTWLGYMLFAATFCSTIVAVLLMPSLAFSLSLYVCGAYLSMALILYAAMLTANRSVGRATPVSTFTRDFVLVLLLSMYISWANFSSLPGTLLGRRRVFVRTPKQGDSAGSLPAGR